MKRPCSEFSSSAPLAQLKSVLGATLELLSLPQNDFSYSSWIDQDAATSEFQELISALDSESIPDLRLLGALFAPTGPIQEVSLSSGWAEEFLRLAEKFDEVEEIIAG